MEGFFRRLKRYKKVAKFVIGLAVGENGRLKALEKFGNATFFADASVDGDSVIGDNVVLHQRVTIVNSTVGRYTYFADGATALYCKIGNFCSIGPDVKIGLGKHPASVFVSTYPAFFATGNGGCQTSFVDSQTFHEFERIEVGNDVWIGARALITDGVKIGDGAIIAAGAVVTKDVEPYVIVGGVPAKPIKHRFAKQEIEELLAYKWWEKDLEWLRMHGKYFDNVTGFLTAVKKADPKALSREKLG